jgi:hypothetical protein
LLSEVIVEVAPETAPDRQRSAGVIKEMAPFTNKKDDRPRPIFEIAPPVKKKAPKEARPEVAPNEKPNC